VLRINLKELLMSQHEYFHHSKAIADVNGIAFKALAALVRESQKQGALAAPRRELCAIAIHEKLMSAIIDSDETLFDQLIDDMVSVGASRQQVTNEHIPAVARALGKAWLEDKMEFANVSIGCARLQGYLRRKGLDWCETAGLKSPTDLSVLLLVPDFEQHTLGATLLAGQLRAKGIYVVTKLHATNDEMLSAAKEREYDAIMISSSRSVTIASLAAIVLNLKTTCAETPLIIGGNVLEQTPGVLAETGADFTATCWQDALGILKAKVETKDADLVGIEG
jgi:methylmalonyl-CoA mutase cobalamin-binding subunit